MAGLSETPDAEQDPEGWVLELVQRLHADCGAPSTRTIASGIGGISHTTVAEVISGRRLNLQPVMRIVRYLGGDPAEVTKVWPAIERQRAHLDVDKALRPYRDTQLDRIEAKVDALMRHLGVPPV